MGVRVWILLTVVMGALLGSCSTEKSADPDAGDSTRSPSATADPDSGDSTRSPSATTDPDAAIDPVPVRYNGLVRARAAQRLRPSPASVASWGPC